MTRELTLLLLSIPFLLLLGLGYNFLNGYFRYRSEKSGISTDFVMKGYVGWTGMVALLYILTTRILGIN